MILFFQKPLKEEMSSVKFSKSFTFGFPIKTSTRPATQPAAIMGLSEVNGDATMAERIVRGCASAAAAPRPARTAFESTHHLIIWVPVEAPALKKPKRMSPQELEKGILDTFKKVYSPDVAIDKGGYFKNVFFELRKKPK